MVFLGHIVVSDCTHKIAASDERLSRRREAKVAEASLMAPLPLSRFAIWCGTISLCIRTM